MHSRSYPVRHEVVRERFLLEQIRVEPQTPLWLEAINAKRECFFLATREAKVLVAQDAVAHRPFGPTLPVRTAPRARPGDARDWVELSDLRSRGIELVSCFFQRVKMFGARRHDVQENFVSAAAEQRKIVSDGTIIVPRNFVVFLSWRGAGLYANPFFNFFGWQSIHSAPPTGRFLGSHKDFLPVFFYCWRPLFFCLFPFLFFLCYYYYYY